ncbi:hypothetical protein VDGE_03154 [Verticillium dahliae]|uniref:BHLH domain-containing protein n=1 Tax=Verticillium dahliae TaxID=27337 RepID=A0A444RWM2_VERDA|nr:hypothetical protein VDGE_03154 [Verticillium dahliae]
MSPTGMAMMGGTSWTTQDQTLPSSHDDDFQQFLDMGGMGNLSEPLGFDFHDFQNSADSSMMPQNGRDQLDTQMGGTDSAMAMARPDPSVRSVQDQFAAMSTAASHPSITAQMIQPVPTPTDAMAEIDAQIQFLQQQRMQQQQRQMHEHQAHQVQQQTSYYVGHNPVPPTPQSLEMPPNGNHYYAQEQAQQNVFDSRYQRMKEQQDMAFTPLVSPAVTPLDPQFQIDPTFTMPGSYFSPLTSPALHAQSESNSPYDHRNSFSNHTSTHNSNHNSPGEMDVETPIAAVPPPVVDLSKKARKNNASRAKGKGSVRQSPISKPMKKKTAPTPKMVSQVLAEMQESNEECSDQMLPPTSLPMPMSSEESENASVSPENLSDMPPPPPPAHNRLSRSPLNGPQHAQQAASAIPAHVQEKPSPATPASLMKLPSSSANGGAVSSNAQTMGAPEHIEDFKLPESANFPKSRLTPLDTNQTPVQSPLEASSAKTASFQPLPSPIFHKPAGTASANQSPRIIPGSTGPAPRRTPNLAPRGSKKRASISSSQVSPALLPRISPSIKPLLPGTPGGMSAEDTASLLLTSKSNYQNILEGTVVPGVSYPTSLSTNLTSKRTSHKIAEQGRRNRINTALQEIATMLPKSALLEISKSESESADKKDGKGGATPNSKASTVEMAIDYIKQLKQEVADANKRAEEAERKLELKQASPPGETR